MMASTPTHLFIPAVFMLILVSLDSTGAQIGIAYGRNGQGLPSPSQVVDIYKSNGIKRMRIYDPFPPTLEALGGSGIELTVGAPNDLLEFLNNRANADAWVRDNIQKYPNVNFKHVVVGNEVSPRRNAQYVGFLVPAMQNVHDALVAAGLGRISVSTAAETDLINPDTNYPPSRGDFREEVKPFMRSVLQFLVNTNAPLFVNIYPYFAYVNSGGAVSLPYALLQPNSGVTTPDGVHYDNLYYALLDVMYSALERSGVASVADSITTMEIKGSESGWPDNGESSPPATATATARFGTDQVAGAANPSNAGTYIRNLIRVVKSGTPKRPNRPIETYIFAMFDENQKPGGIEKHFGVFQPNGQSKYGPINFN